MCESWFYCINLAIKMVWEFSFKNFFSFKDESTLSLVPWNIKKDDLRNNIFSENNILKTAIIYWPNASWKSTILRAMFFLKMLILNSHKINPKENFNSWWVLSEMRLLPFLLDKISKSNPTEFAISFIHNNIQYRYAITLTMEKIISEYLLWYYSWKATTLISRDWNKLSFDSKYFKNAKKIESEIRENQLALSVCADKNIKEAVSIYSYFETIHIFLNWIMNEFDTLKMLEEDISWEFKKFLVTLLKNSDSSIWNILFKKDKIKFWNIPEVEKIKFRQHWLIISDDTELNTNSCSWFHQVPNSKIWNMFSLDYESQWTKEIFKLAWTIYNVMKKNMVFFWDEFDKSLHPDLTRQIIKIIHWFNWWQFIFNTHDTTLLDIKSLFRRDQIRFVEKNQYWESQLYSLLEFKDRSKSNIEKNYLKGRYGAIPFFDENNLF